MTMRFLLLLATIACDSPSTPGVEPVEPGTVLFVGNSLTYWNEMPFMVQALADASAPGTMQVRVVAFPDFNLEDHVARGDAMKAIRRGGWHVVILQQGPSTLSPNRAQLRASARAFAAEIMKVGARPALFAVWPSRSRMQDFDAAHESYALAATDVSGMLLPVGEAWRAAWRRDENMPLYSSDGLHPSVEGSYLAALVIAGRLTGRSPVGMPRELTLVTGARIAIATSRSGALQQAAAEVLAAEATTAPHRAPRQSIGAGSALSSSRRSGTARSTIGKGDRARLTSSLPFDLCEQ
jgi:hypothetical protein